MSETTLRLTNISKSFAGKLGNYTVNPDGTVLLGKPTIFGKDNIDQFNF